MNSDSIPKNEICSLEWFEGLITYEAEAVTAGASA